MYYTILYYTLTSTVPSGLAFLRGADIVPTLYLLHFIIFTPLWPQGSPFPVATMAAPTSSSSYLLPNRRAAPDDKPTKQKPSETSSPRDSPNSDPPSADDAEPLSLQEAATEGAVIVAQRELSRGEQPPAFELRELQGCLLRIQFMLHIIFRNTSHFRGTSCGYKLCSISYLGILHTSGVPLRIHYL